MDANKTNHHRCGKGRDGCPAFRGEASFKEQVSKGVYGALCAAFGGKGIRRCRRLSQMKKPREQKMNMDGQESYCAALSGLVFLLGTLPGVGTPGCHMTAPSVLCFGLGNKKDRRLFAGLWFKGIEARV